MATDRLDGPSHKFKLLKEQQARQSVTNLHAPGAGNEAGKMSAVRLKVNKLTT